MWGQNANMEMRFANSGSDLVFDWGGNSSLTITSHPFTDRRQMVFHGHYLG